MPATELSAVTDRLRRARTETDARAAISHLSPEEFVRYLARNAAAHRQRLTPQAVAPIAIIGAWLALSALACENPKSYADLSTTAARLSLASQSEHVRAAAEAFQETVNRHNRKA